jgi:hypothetical protein
MTIRRCRSHCDDSPSRASSSSMPLFSYEELAAHTREIALCSALLTGLLGIILLSGCGQASSPQEQTSAAPQTQASAEAVDRQRERALQKADDDAWARVLEAGTLTALSAYLENHASGIHAGEARQRLAVLQEKAHAQAEDKAWADASRDGTAAAIRVFLQNFAAGAHAAEARARLVSLEEKARKDADDKAWADVLRNGTGAAVSLYLKNYSDGAHTAEARQRLSALEEQSRKDADEKAWAEASSNPTAATMNTYLQQFESGTHAQEARQRVTALEQQAQQQEQKLRQRNASAIGVPPIDIRKTCKAIAAASGGFSSPDGCTRSELRARDAIVEKWAEFSKNARTSCMRPDVYLPSYVEWLTCLEMERDVRNLHRSKP